MLAILRSVLAVATGLVVTIATFAFEILNGALAPSRDLKIDSKLLMIAYAVLCVTGGGYVTAWLARRSRIRHALILGVIEAVITMLILRAARAPVWSSVFGIIVVIPAAWLGGVLEMRHLERKTV